ncbi:MAG: HK97 family phage prohead protease [Oscillospiraceae bacterium]|nr:HK97 family phage prohead protease [Oscillospiraceae bacterium]
MNKTIEQKLNEGRSFRSMEIKALEDNDYIVEGYASTFNQPYQLYSEQGWRLLEQVAPTAFDAAEMDDVIMQYDHAGRVFARKSNGTLEISTDEHGLKIRADLGGTEIGRQLYEEIKGGYTSKMSFGFTVDKDERATTKDGDTTTVLRTITGIKRLYDVSAVSLPANDATEISARCDGEGVIAEAKQELQAAIELREQKEKVIALINLLKEA